MKLFRLTLRDLFWLVLVVALMLGWWNHVRQLQSDARRMKSDLYTQARFADQFVSVLTKLGCEVPPDSDPRCVSGGPYSRVFCSPELQQQTHCVSFTLSGTRQDLQRALDGEFYR